MKSKKCLDFRMRDPGCVHLWVKFTIQNVVSRKSRRKISKIFHSGASFSCVFDEMPIEVSYLFKTLWNVDQVYSEPCHWTLFSPIQASSEPCATLAYAETWHSRKSSIFASRRIFRTLSYSLRFTNIQKSDIFKTWYIFRNKVELFAK